VGNNMVDTPKQLTKKIPARTKRVDIEHVIVDWLEMNQKYRDIRSKSRRKMDTCFCGHKFIDGEKMSLAFVVNGPNIVLCHKCVEGVEST
jgi:hypothetical protein